MEIVVRRGKPLFLPSLLLASIVFTGCDRFMNYRWDMYPAQEPARDCVVRALQEDGAAPSPGSDRAPIAPSNVQILEGRDYAIARTPVPTLTIFDRRIQLRYSADTEAKIIGMFEKLERDIAAKCQLTLTQPSRYSCGGC